MGILLEKCNIYIDDFFGLMLMEVCFCVWCIVCEYGGIGLIMIDYLQLMCVLLFFDNCIFEIVEIFCLLKVLVKELQVLVVVLLQFNCLLEQCVDKCLVNFDLCEFGFIEQDVDLIMFIYCDEVYYENSDFKGIVEIIIGK